MIQLSAKKLSALLFFSVLLSGAAQATPIFSSTSPISSVSSQDSGVPGLPDINEMAAGHGGIETGNGGYGIRCSTNGDLLRSYDLLVAQQKFDSELKLAPVKTYSSSLVRIGALIESKLPALKPSFDEFVAELFIGNSSNRYLWTSEDRAVYYNTFSISNFYSEEALNACPSGQSAQEANLDQIIKRVDEIQDGGTQIHFYYNPELWMELSPLDRSFLLVHEWLWNLTGDINANHEADYLLHSTWLETASPEEVLQRFKGRF